MLLRRTCLMVDWENAAKAVEKVLMMTVNDDDDDDDEMDDGSRAHSGSSFSARSVYSSMCDAIIIKIDQSFFEDKPVRQRFFQHVFFRIA